MPSDGEGMALPPALVWIEGFSVGVAELDDDHRALIRDAGAIVEAIRARRPWRDVEALAGLMVERCIAHFRREEASLERDAFASLPEHRREHARIEADLQRILARIRKPDPPDEDMIEAALQLRHVLVDHLLQYDLAYKSHAMAKRGR